MNRQQFIRAGAALAASPLAACTTANSPDSYEAAVNQIWRPSSSTINGKLALQRELVRCATLAPSGHNTQCWKFHVETDSISILPDFSRRTPVVNPDDHHLFVSLGCALENLAQASSAYGLNALPQFDATKDVVTVKLLPTTPLASPLFKAITDRQCTRGLYSITSGNPSVPRWLGSPLFDILVSAKSENDKYAKQTRSSAGMAVFVSEVNDKTHWIEAGRCYERFALQATSMGIRNAMLNQTVEVPSTRRELADFLGLQSGRPDLVVRFGRGAKMPQSLRRRVEDVLV